MKVIRTVRCRVCYRGFDVEVEAVQKVNFCQDSCQSNFMEVLKKEAIQEYSAAFIRNLNK